MQLRKMFRFKYEPCNGTCYAWCDTLVQRLREIPDREDLVALMVKAHDRLCDNPEYSFGVDGNNAQTDFVAHFRTPERTDLYHGQDFAKVVESVCKAVLATEIPALVGACTYGASGAENLGQEILSYCTEDGYKRLQAEHCECKD